MDKCRDMNIHRKNGQFDYPLFGTVHIFLKRNDIAKYLIAIYYEYEAPKILKERQRIEEAQRRGKSVYEVFKI